jgi:5-amino-6-(5-phosphoribosylamino)uracil reductase
VTGGRRLSWLEKDAAIAGDSSRREVRWMADRPYTVLSCGMSIDGYLDSAGGRRLRLSNAADFDRVDEVRAGCDAILVGAGTVRSDNPRLLVRSAARRAERTARGLPASPVKVTLTRRGDLAASAAFFTTGRSEKIVYCPTSSAEATRRRLTSLATVVDTGPAEDVDLASVAEDLSARGITRLMVEGGRTVLTQFLLAGLVDELHLVVAPLFVGDSAAPRLVGDGRYPWNARRRATLADVRQIGDVVLLRYALSDRFFAERPSGGLR